MHLIRQSTASTVTVGPVLDSTGAAVTSAVVGDFRISKNGTTATLSGATVTHDANGYYNIALTTGNTDTAGRLVLFSGNTAQSMGAHRFTVLLPSVFDALISNATNATGGLPTATGAISAFAGAISTLTAGGVRTELATELSRIDQTIGSRSTQTSVDTLASYVDTEVAAIKAKTDNLPAQPAAVSDIPTANQNRDAVMNAMPNGGWVDGSFGDRWLISANNTRNLAITGSGHIAAVLHDAEPNSIPEDAFVSGAISARAIGTDAIDADALADGAITAGVFAADSITATALATDAVNEIRDAVAAITPIADLATMIINDGTANARYSVSALQNGPSGAGGSTINVYPVSASTPERVAGTTITYYRDENRAVSVVTDFVLDALTLEFVVEDSEGTDLLVIADGSISKSNKTFTVTIGTEVTATISNYRWSLRDITSGSNSVIARGVLSVQEAASNG